jgi:hypothetical protein
MNGELPSSDEPIDHWIGPDVPVMMPIIKMLLPPRNCTRPTSAKESWNCDLPYPQHLPNVPCFCVDSPSRAAYDST